jgi:hypothetical protein
LLMSESTSMPNRYTPTNTCAGKLGIAPWIVCLALFFGGRPHHVQHCGAKRR